MLQESNFTWDINLRKMSTFQPKDSKCEAFYLNLVLLNKEEVVNTKVAEKTGLRQGSLLSKAANFAANKMVKDEKILSTLSEKLIEGIHKAVSDLNITATLENKFQQGSYVVIRVQVNDFDTMSLILTAKGSEFASDFATLLVAVNHLGMADVVSNKVEAKITSMINEGMMKKFSDIIPTKLAERGLHVECTTCTLAEQADFFFDTLSKLNENK